MSSVSGNTWKGKGAPGAQPLAQPQAQSQSVPAEQHTPVKDFNAGEVKEFLKKSKRIARLGWRRKAVSLAMCSDEHSAVHALS